MSVNEMWEAWGRTNALYTAWCAAAGENQCRLFVLYALNAHEPVTQKSIADSTGLSKQTVSTVMRALKAEGLVALQSETTDRREKSVRLTERGKKYADETLAPLYALEKRVSELVGAERMKQMNDAIALFNLVFEKEMAVQSNERSKQ